MTTEERCVLKLESLLIAMQGHVYTAINWYFKSLRQDRISVEVKQAYRLQRYDTVHTHTLDHS